MVEEDRKLAHKESPATPENSVDSSVQVKRKRGRPKKSAQTNEEETDNPMTAIQSKTHIKAETDNTEKTDVDGASNKTKIKYGQKMSMKESSTSDLASFEGKETSHYPDTGIANGSEKKEKRREVHVNYKSCSDDEGGGLVIDEGEDDAAEKNEKLQNADLKKPVRKRSKTGDITETDEDDSLDKELNSPKRKGIPKITDSDEDVQDNPIIKSSSASKCVQGKQLKRKSADSKLAKDEEAEKIKAMADAMKRKLKKGSWNLNLKKPKLCLRFVQFGVDSILQSSEFRPRADALKGSVIGRVNAFNSEIMKIEAVQFQDLVPPESLFCPKQAFADLDMILQQIKSLSVGQYLVRNNPKKETMNIMKAVTEPDSMCYDLHLAHTTLMMSKVNKPPVIQWLPIDTRHLLPHHKKLNLIPCTFPPPGEYCEVTFGG
ncbi:uncharacterized protein LOC127831576 [Dreissena polymorpha]|uniref:uncharacterized protein LOC127831576 n=1 Tax=Dreissena polymorpha TaxID=45954 RepID=UPI0022642D5E|nr:uncharacterized protein LOC127831576 [Dreissena polymorpha]